MDDYAKAFKKSLDELRGDDPNRIVTETENWIRIEDEAGIRMLNKNAVSQITIFDKEPSMMKQCKHCKKKFEPSFTAHHCHVESRLVSHEDDENDFLDTAIAVAVAAELLSDSGSSCDISSDTSSSCDVPDASPDFGGDGGDFGGGGSSSDW